MMRQAFALSPPIYMIDITDIVNVNYRVYSIQYTSHPYSLMMALGHGPRALHAMFARCGGARSGP